MYHALDRAHNLLFPPRRCLLCGRALEYHIRENPRIPVCSACLAEPPKLQPPRCSVCGRPLLSELGTCTLCRERSYPFFGHRSLYEYRGTVKKLIRLYKFSQVRPLARFFADRLAEEISSPSAPGGPFDFGAVIVPVPGNPASVRRRGWDQVLLIARCLANDHSLPLAEILCRRRSKTQKSLGFTSRTQNLRGKIRVRKRRGAGKTPEDILLLDDVFTTGSTAAECTRILLEAGAVKVRVITLAID